MPRRPAAALLAAAVAVTAGPAAALEPDLMLRYVPAPVNAVAVVNCAAILRTPRAQKGQWAKLPQTEYLAGAIPLNPAIERLLLASEFVPTHPEAGSGLAVASMTKPIELADVAKAEGGEMTTAGDEPALLTPAGGYVVKLGPDLLGAMRTDHRPDVGRWVRFAKTTDKSVQSRYLNAAVNNFGASFHLLVALDTQDLIHPAQARLAVAQSRVSEADKKTSEAVEKYVVGMTGVRFTANLTDTGFDATLRIDSKVQPTMPPDVMKGFVIETLERNGAGLRDLSAAAVKLEGNTVILSFAVADSELGRIMSVFLPAAAGLDDSDRLAITPDGVTLEASKRYYQAISRLLDELDGRKDKGKKFDTVATWYQTAATKIETISVLGVDPDLVKYGQSVAGRLGAIGDSLKGVPIQAAQLESQAFYSGPRHMYYGRGGLRFTPWSYGYTFTNVPQIQGEINQLVKKDEENRKKMWQQIDSERGRARADMARKFSEDFEPTK